MHEASNRRTRAGRIAHAQGTDLLNRARTAGKYHTIEVPDTLDLAERANAHRYLPMAHSEPWKHRRHEMALLFREGEAVLRPEGAGKEG